MGFFSWLSQAPKVTDTACELAKDISSGVDMLFYTDEEKAHAQQKAFDAWLEMTKALGPSSARDISRRWIAVMVMVMCMALTVTGLIAAWMDHKALYDTALAFFGNWWKVALTVAVFYFGPHVIGAVTGKK